MKLKTLKIGDVKVNIYVAVAET